MQTLWVTTGHCWIDIHSNLGRQSATVRPGYLKLTLYCQVVQLIFSSQRRKTYTFWNTGSVDNLNTTEICDRQASSGSKFKTCTILYTTWNQWFCIIIFVIIELFQLEKKNSSRPNGFIVGIDSISHMFKYLYTCTSF